MKKLKVLFLFVLLSLFAVQIVSAQGGGSDLAHVRFAHFVPDGSNVDLFIDGQNTALNDVVVGTVSAWYQLPAGSYGFALVPVLQPYESALYEGTVTVKAGGWYTVAAIGLVELGTVEYAVIEEDYSLMGFGETRLNAFNAIPEFNAVDVLLNGDVLFGFLAYPGAETMADGSLSDGFDSATLPEVTGVISVVDNIDPTNTLVELDEFSFSADRNYFIGVIGIAASPSWVLASTNMTTLDSDIMGDLRDTAIPSGDNGYLRIAHLSSSAPALDVYINGELSDFMGVEFTDMTDFVTLANGTYSVSLTPEGTSIDNALIQSDITLNGGEHITLVAYGFIETNTLAGAAIQEDFSPLDVGLFRIAMFNADTSLLPVDLIRDDGLDAIRYLGYPNYDATSDGFASVDLLAGEYAFTIVNSLDPTQIIAEIPTTLYSPGRTYFIGVTAASGTGYTFDFVDVPN